MHDVLRHIPQTMPEVEHFTRPLLRPEIIALFRAVAVLCFAVAMAALCVQLWREKQSPARGAREDEPEQTTLDELLERSRARRKPGGTRKDGG